MKGQRTTDLRAKYLAVLENGRPSTIEEVSWGVFLAHVRDGQTIREIGRDLGLSKFKVGKMITRVELDLEILRPAGERLGTIALDSPIESLSLSGRARNALRKAGCVTIQNLVDNDFSSSIRRLGRITREEIVTALNDHGFGTPASLTEARTELIADLDQELNRLREQIDVTSRHWQTRLERLEHRLKKLTAQPDLE